MFHKVKEHVWRDFGPFLYADPFKILHILGFALINFQLRPQVFRLDCGPATEMTMAEH